MNNRLLLISLCIVLAPTGPQSQEAQKVKVPVAVTWNYYPQPKTLVLHLTNNSGKDITAYNVSVRNKYADGTHDDQCCGSQSSSEFLGGLIAAQMAKGTPSEQFADRANSIFVAGTTRDLLLFGGSQNEPSCLVSLQTEGSVPEFPGLFDCINKLDGKPYAKEEANACLRSLKNTNYFEDAQVREEPIEPGKLSVTFFLRSKSLELNSVDFDMPEQDRTDFLAWSQGKARLLEQGAPYEREIALETVHAVEFFYQHIGITAKVSTNTRLDYRTGKASVTFHVTTGPHLAQQDLVPPYAPECYPIVTGLDWSDIDDNTPIPLVKSLVALRGAGACFTSEKLNSDERILQGTGIFEDVKVSSSGTLDDRGISLHLRTKALPLRWIKLQHYGPSPGGNCNAVIHSPDKGKTYSRAEANALKQKLEIACRDENIAADAYEQDLLLDGPQLGLLFHVVRYPKYELVINGKRIIPSEEQTRIASH